MRIVKGIALASKLSPRQKNHVHGSGLNGQAMFEKACLRRKIDAVPVWETSKFDYLVGNIRVEVKYTSGDPVNLTKNIPDFDVVVIARKKDKAIEWFILPEFVIHGKKGIDPASRPYRKFKNAWFLLKTIDGLT